ncbi:GNAT family N-acetyltransferase [Vampirovibrio sp.]|uniref:GNAT family N-acetyltransferase n=1 Tax=Vampirovibrio sp. TaxID=2717857 RepID=UPI003593F235
MITEAPDITPASAPPLNAATHPTHYHVHVINTMAEWLPLKAEWDGLLNRAGIENLCMTHGWMTQWLQQFPADELLIVIIQDAQGQWIGAAPFKISKGSHGLTHKQLRHLQLIGTQPNVYDWMTLVVLPGEDETAMIQTMAQAIQNRRWDILDFRFMRSQEQCVVFCEALQPGQSAQAVVSNTAMPYVALPPTVAAYEKVRRKKTRLEVNRHCNRFAKDFGHPPKLEFQMADEASEAALNRFISAHIRYWADKHEKSDFHRFPKLRLFYKNMLAYSQFQAEPHEPKLLFSILKVGKIHLSYQLGFWQGQSYLSHITNFNQGFRSYSPGTIHMDNLVFETLNRQGQRFELGRGDEPYKHLWTREKELLWDLRLFKTPVAHALWDTDQVLKKIMGKTTG